MSCMTSMTSYFPYISTTRTLKTVDSTGHDTKLANKGKITSTTEVIVYQYYIFGIQCMTCGNAGAYITSNNICAKGYYANIVLMNSALVTFTFCPTLLRSFTVNGKFPTQAPYCNSPPTLQD